MNPLESNQIAQAVAVSRRLLIEVQPMLDYLNQLYNSEGGGSTSITQADLDSAANLSGLTKQELDDGMYALTGPIRTAIETSYAQLAALAARS